MIAQTASTRTITLRHIEDDIVELLFFDNQTLSEEDVMENYEMLDILTEYQPHKRIVISGHFTEITHGAREVLLRENTKRSNLIKAEAIVIHSIAQKIFSYLYYKLNKNNYPICIFDNIPDAMDWLKLQ